MRIFFDTEFIDDGTTVDLISIGMVREDGKEYYAESSEYAPSKACEWVRQNVYPHLTGPEKSRGTIAREIAEFVGPHPEFWAYYAAYDWLCLCQLYGRMLDVPADWPNFVNDLQSVRYLRGETWQPEQDEAHHNALNDARWNLKFFRYLVGPAWNRRAPSEPPK